MLRNLSFAQRSAALVLLVLSVLLSAAWAQEESVLYDFCSQNYCVDGQSPSAGVVFDDKGNLYGTTTTGGAHEQGEVFKFSPKGKETVLYSFCAQVDCADGANPFAGVVFDQKGNLYGTTYNGGVEGYGVVFRLTPEGKETALYSFCARDNCLDGYNPAAGLVLDHKGNLYGTTSYGGTHAGGVVFELTPEGKETVLYNFCTQGGYNCTDGGVPLAELIFDRKGNLYGTASYGGTHSRGGVVFKLTPENKYTVLHSFCAQTNCFDGWGPVAGLIFDQKGNLYGTTQYGGGYSYGVVFKLTSMGKETVLSRFVGTSGEEPVAGLTFDQKGNLYGTTQIGGDPTNNGGVVFKLDPKGNETVLHIFCAQTYCTDGLYPEARVIFDKKGNLYGTTHYGGLESFPGAGVLFKLTRRSDTR